MSSENAVKVFEYRGLSTESQLNGVKAVKTVSETMWDVLDSVEGDPRMLALAKTKLEECSMWANKAISRGK